MTARKSPARPLVDAQRDPYAAFARSEYDDAAALARKLPIHESRILLARIALRERRPDEALELLVGRRPGPDPVLESERNLLLATTYERLGRHDDAEPLYALPLPRNASHGLQNERLYLRALGHWMRGEHDRAEDLIAQQRPDPHPSFALGRDLFGWIAVGRRDYDAAATHFGGALELFERSSLRDEGARASCVLNLAIIGVETLDLAICARVAQAYPRMPQTRWTKRLSFQTGQYLVRFEALRGEDAGAFGLASELLRTASGPNETLTAHVSLAEFLRVRGDTAAPRYHLELAARELRSARWSRSNADDAMAALLYCVQASYVDPHGASEALTRILSSSGTSDALLSFEYDSRAMALALYARGRVAIGLGRAREGEELLRRAVAIWTDHTYRYRLTLAALDLAAVFHDRRSIELAREMVAAIPGSWLAREERRLSSRLGSGLADLSRAERRVLHYLCEGKSNREIAEALQRSESTIRNQTQRIFDVLKINSRAALVARSADWGL